MVQPVFPEACISFLTLIWAQIINDVQCKGGAVIGGSVSGGSTLCIDCTPGGNYTYDEMKVALIILTVILCVFFALCTCQCYHRMKEELDVRDNVKQSERCSVPEAPYIRDSSKQ